MGRSRLALELIKNEKARKNTYEKRKKNMMKKAQELSTLCGVDTCVITYGPAGSATVAKPEIWPASPEKVKWIIERYMSEEAHCRAKRTVGLPEFFMAKKRKVDAELAKVRLANWEAKYPVSEALIEVLFEEDWRRLLGSLRSKLEAARARLVVMKEDAMRRSPDHMVGSFEDHCLSGGVLPGQDFHFANSEGMMLSETSSYGPNMDNLSPEGALSSDMCYNSLMDQPALFAVPLSRQDFHFANSEGMMLSETSSYGPDTDNLSPEGALSSDMCYDSLMDQPALSLVPLSGQDFHFANLEGMMLSETSSYIPSTDNLSPEGALSSDMCYNSLMDQSALPPVPLSGQDFHFANLEGMMLSETSSYSPSMDNLSPEGALSFDTCYNSLMDQPALPLVPLSGQDFHFANLEGMMLFSETSSYSPNTDNLSSEGTLSFSTCYNSLLDQPALPSVPLSGQDFHFANLEGMTLSETSSFGPSTNNLSPEGAMSFGTCYNSLMDQPALPPVPLSVMQGDRLPSQMMQATSLGYFQFLDYY